MATFKIISFAAPTLLLSSLAFALTAIEASDKYRAHSQTNKMLAEIEVVNKDDKSVYEVFNKETNVLAVQIKPERSAKRKLLMKDDDLWLYTPGIKKPVRIGIEQRLVGDVSNGDILRTRFKDDYTFTFLKKEANTDVYELVRSSKAAAYAKIHYYLENKTNKPVKAVFFAASGKILKTAEYQKFEKIFNEELCVLTKITDATTGRVSLIKNSRHKLIKLEDNFFNKDSIVEQ